MWSVITTFTHHQPLLLDNTLKQEASNLPQLQCFASLQNITLVYVICPNYYPADVVTSFRLLCVCCTANGAHPFGYELFMHNWIRAVGCDAFEGRNDQRAWLRSEMNKAGWSSHTDCFPSLFKTQLWITHGTIWYGHGLRKLLLVIVWWKYSCDKYNNSFGFVCFKLKSDGKRLILPSRYLFIIIAGTKVATGSFYINCDRSCIMGRKSDII